MLDTLQAYDHQPSENQQGEAYNVNKKGKAENFTMH